MAEVIKPKSNPICGIRYATVAGAAAPLYVIPLLTYGDQDYVEVSLAALS